MIAAFVGSLVLVTQLPVEPSPAVPRWSLQVAPTTCVLEGQAGPSSNVSIYTTPGSDSYGFAVADRALTTANPFGPMSLTFDPSKQVLKGFAKTLKLPDGTSVISMTGLSPVLLDDLKGAKAVTVVAGPKVRLTLSVENATEAVETLRNCAVSRLVEWGADATQFAPGGKGPTALRDRDEWVPDGKLIEITRRSKRNMINDDFRVTVAPDGTISECRALAGVTDAETENVACGAVLNKQLFSPATNASGSPVRGVATFRVTVMTRPR